MLAAQMIILGVQRKEALLPSGVTRKEGEEAGGFELSLKEYKCIIN